MKYTDAISSNKHSVWIFRIHSSWHTACMWRRLIRPYYGYAHSAAFNADKVITKWILCAISLDGVQLAHVRHYTMTMDIFRHFIRATFASVTRTRSPSIPSCLGSDDQFRNKMCRAEPNKDDWNGCVKPNIARVYQHPARRATPQGEVSGQENYAFLKAH